jgi:E1A-binding protein p400
VSSAARLSAKARDAWCQRVAFPALAPLRHAHVRRQLFFPDRRLVQFDCGKLQALATLLRTLKSGGHKVLIFTQMTKMLDILEAFLNLYGYAYCRLDGSTRPEQRQILMQRFNTDERLFAFILSTRSGGFGINLTGADTVVFYDSDWNPAMDQQAQDRAHRIGQTREVHIYRMVCKGTIEENILRKSMQKRELDHFAIQAGNFNTEHFTKEAARRRDGGGDGDGDGEANALVVGGEQGAAAMSIFDKAMSRVAVAKATPEDGDGGAAGAAKGDSGADEVARLMDEAQDDVDKAAAATAANEEADDAAEFGDDIREKEPGEDLDDDGPGGGSNPGSKPGSAVDLKRLGGAGASSDALALAPRHGSPPATPAPDDENRTLSLTRVNTSLEGDDAFAEEMMRKVQASASRGEALEMQLKPVERYAVRYLEETIRILDDVDATATAIADFEEKEWELEQLEKQKAAAEAAEDDDELIIEGWETGVADDEYRRRVEDARREAEQRAEHERREAERWAAMYAVPSLEAEAATRAAAGADSDSAGPSGVGTGGGIGAGDPFASGVPRRARSGSPAPGGAAAGAPLRVTFRMGGARGPSGLSKTSTGADPVANAAEPFSESEAKKKAKKEKKRKREGETEAERDERRRLRRLSKEGAKTEAASPSAAAFASPGGGRVAVSPVAPGAGAPENRGAGKYPPWRVDEDAVLCALVDEFGGASWDLAAHAIAHRDAAQCKDRFRRIAASRASSLAGASAPPAQLRVTPEVTKALFRQTAEETFPGCEGAPEPATALRADVRAARGALATGGGASAAKAAVAAAAARFFAKVLEFGR